MAQQPRAEDPGGVQDQRITSRDDVDEVREPPMLECA